MKRAAIALAGLTSRISGAVGLEGAFLLVGTVCLAVFSASISPAGPWAVVGSMFVLAGVALAIPERRQ